jgi:hypothetical protein
VLPCHLAVDKSFEDEPLFLLHYRFAKLNKVLRGGRIAHHASTLVRPSLDVLFDIDLHRFLRLLHRPDLVE